MTYWNANNESPAESNHRSAVRISSSRSQHHEQTAVTGCCQRLKDTDGNGISDYLDPDDDGDGTQDADDSDDDNDGTPDAQDLDDDVDGTPDTVEKTTKGVDRMANTNRDGAPDHLDLNDDSDKLRTFEIRTTTATELPTTWSGEIRTTTEYRTARTKTSTGTLHLLSFTAVMYGGVFWVGTQNVNV